MTTLLKRLHVLTEIQHFIFYIVQQFLASTYGGDTVLVKDFRGLLSSDRVDHDKEPNNNIILAVV
jgi:hypothetical protein